MRALSRRTVAAGLAACAVRAGAAIPNVAGIRSIAVTASARGGVLDLSIWYPAFEQGEQVRVGQNAVFAGTRGWRNAPIAMAGRLPLVLLSHGGLRAAAHTGGWIAAALAARGYVVAAPHPTGPPPTSAGDAISEIWLRPADLSASLTALLADAEWSARIDTARVSAAGFLLGGTVVLALAGARIDPMRFVRTCDSGDGGMDCAAFAREGADLGRVDGARLAASHADDRIQAVVVVAPELAQSFGPETLSTISVPVRSVRFGDNPPALDDAALRAIPGVAHATVPNATHVAAFGPCTPRGAAILREEGDDPALCDVPMRADIHARLTDMVVAGLR